MKAWSRISITLCGLLACSVGCTAKSPFFVTEPNPLSPQRQAATTQAAPAAQTAQTHPYLQASQSKFDNLFRKASHSVSNAFRIEPRVDTAIDPLSLNNEVRSVPPAVYAQSGRLHEASGNVPSALDQYKRAVDAGADDVDTLIRYARLYDRQGKFDEALQVYHHAVELNSNNPVIWNDLGLCYARHNDVDAAIKSLSRAISLDPNSQMYRNNLATVLIESDRLEEAFQQLAAVNKKSVAHYNLGVLLYQRNKQPQAVEQFQLALNEDPSLMPAHTILAQIQPQPTRLPTGPMQSPMLAQPQPNWTPQPGGMPPQNVGPYQTPAQPAGYGMPPTQSQFAPQQPQFAPAATYPPANQPTPGTQPMFQTYQQSR